MRPPRRALLLLLLPAVALGLLAGWHVATLTETDVIEAAAARHVARGGVATDCAAVPGVPPVWITVICRGDPSSAFQSDRFGRLTEIEPDTAVDVTSEDLALEMSND